MNLDTDLKKRLTALTICGFVLLASACNTVQGIGQDLESAGDKAQEITNKDG